MRSSGIFKEFLHVSILLASVTCFTSSQPEVGTNSGSIRGVTNDVLGVNVSSFLGIPYAKPPVGRLRFRAPVPIEPWADTLNATGFGNICPQDRAEVDSSADILAHTRIDEDCLTLNVFTPDGPENADMAVMIFIHGGGFSAGNTLLYDGAVIAASQSVVVATVNYRLGALGFLSTMDNYATGNFGLLDQQLAIRWVKENAAAFGGDPNKITLFGQSTGGVSVGLHLLSPTSNGLFRRGVSQSGVPSSFYVADEPVNWARRLGSALNCSDGASREDHRHLISCLRSKTWQEIIDNTPGTNPLDLFNRNFLPVVDGRFLPSEPAMLMSSRSNFTNYDYMLGFTNAEGNSLYLLPKLQNSRPDFSASPGLTPPHFEDFVTYSTRPYGDNLHLVKNAALDRYTDWANVSSDFSRLLQLFKFYGDQIYVAPTVETARKHARLTDNGYNTFVYQFSYEGDSLLPARFEGAHQGAELPYLFGAPLFLPSLYTAAQRELSSTLMKYWGNFAKTGNPNDGEPVDVAWSQFTTDNHEFVDLNSPTTTEERPMAADVAFWLNYIPSLSGVCPALPTNCIDVVGEDLGLSLTVSQASTLIQGLVAFVIALFVVIFMLIGVVCGYHMKVKTRERKDNVDKNSDADDVVILSE